MQNLKSIVTMVYECYFFNQLLHCIGMACSLYQRQKDAEVKVTQPSELAKYIQEF